MNQRVVKIGRMYFITFQDEQGEQKRWYGNRVRAEDLYTKLGATLATLGDNEAGNKVSKKCL